MGYLLPPLLELLSVCILLFQFPLCVYSQQVYAGNKVLDCSRNQSGGYQCNGPISCQSYVAFRAQEPYDYPFTIARLLGSETSDIAKINKVSETEKLPTDRLIIVPVSCSCWGDAYQHFPAQPYVVQRGETYFNIANQTFQGLTTCGYVMTQNNFFIRDPTQIPVGAPLMIPVRCACPSHNQSVDSLLVYMVTWGDTVEKTGKEFGVSAESISKANMLSEDSIIYPFTPLLIPMKHERCSVKPSFLCVPDNEGFPIKLVTVLGVGIGFGLLCFVLLGYRLYRYHKERHSRIRKENLFKQNGGLLLKQQGSSGGIHWMAKVFSEEEICKATDNYNPSRFLGQGGYGTVYKGMLLDGTIVAVKKAKTIERCQIDQFINEVIILSQINHRNVVKLLGCCLETEFPLLVYEFISNGTLSSHIHQQDLEHSLSWETRLRIASEVAGAVAYMHSATSIPIFHRDIKSSNILLDDRCSSKVSDFGTSRSMPTDKTHLTTAVKGTFGYLDPEYFYSSQFTEKSDVYSFGVVLLELLTGEKPISFARDVPERNLAAYFRASVENNILRRVLDPRVANEAEEEDILVIADLAMKCLKSSGTERPTMKEVAMELDGLRKSRVCSQEIQTTVKETDGVSTYYSTTFSTEVASISI